MKETGKKIIKMVFKPIGMVFTAGLGIGIGIGGACGIICKKCEPEETELVAEAFNDMVTGIEEDKSEDLDKIKEAYEKFKD